MLTAALQKQPACLPAIEPVRAAPIGGLFGSQNAASWYHPQHCRQNPQNSEKRLPDTETSSSEFISTEYKVGKAYLPCLWSGQWRSVVGDYREGKGSPGVQVSAHPTLWSECTWQMHTWRFVSFSAAQFAQYCSHKTNKICEEARRAPHPFLLFQSETGHLIPASAVAISEKPNKQMLMFKQRALHPPCACAAFLLTVRFRLPSSLGSTGPGPCVIQVSRWLKKRDSAQSPWSGLSPKPSH